MKMSSLKGVCLFFNLFVAFGAVTKQQQHLRALREPAVNQSAFSFSKKNKSAQVPAATFTQYYNSVTSGRGIWKWNNALDAYDKHFARFKNQAVKFGEVGVWSGGSIWMWQAVLGAQCHVYGFDIMPTAQAFNDARCTMTIMDQADPAAWAHFFSAITPTVDIMVDDGGHQPHQMLQTTQGVWPHLTQGGIMAIEDINGAKFLQEMFIPVSNFYGARTHELASVHMYPLVLIAEKLAPWSHLKYWATPAIHVTTMEELNVVIHQTGAPGSSVMVENAAWGTFHSSGNLGSFFGFFNNFYVPAGTVTVPNGCEKGSSPQCEYTIVNNDLQNRVIAVHIFPFQLVVELAHSPPVIQAIRRGTEWVDYGR